MSTTKINLPADKVRMGFSVVLATFSLGSGEERSLYDPIWNYKYVVGIFFSVFWVISQFKKVWNENVWSLMVLNLILNSHLQTGWIQANYLTSPSFSFFFGKMRTMVNNDNDGTYRPHMAAVGIKKKTRHLVDSVWAELSLQRFRSWPLRHLQADTHQHIFRW